jgi:hypothetical protein
MMSAMSDQPVHVKTENLDDAPSSNPPPVDDSRVVRQNQPVSRTVKMASLNLEEKPKIRPTNKPGTPMTNKQRRAFFVLAVIAVAAGLGTGYGAYRLKAKTGDVSPTATQQVAGEVVNNGDVFGIKDDQTFKDSAEGYLEAGGVDGEGSHSLLREGGVSQTVYLTSSITDLDKLVGMQVKVWGETFKGQKAGWLMDVGRVQVIDKDAQPPVEN